MGQRKLKYAAQGQDARRVKGRRPSPDRLPPQPGSQSLPGQTAEGISKMKNSKFSSISVLLIRQLTTRRTHQELKLTAYRDED